MDRSDRKPNIADYLIAEARTRDARFGFARDAGDIGIDFARVSAAITAREATAAIVEPIIPSTTIEADGLSMVKGETYNVIAEAGRITDVA